MTRRPQTWRLMTLAAVVTLLPLAATAAGPQDVTRSIEGDAVTLSIEVSAQGQDIKVDYVGSVDGDTMTGKVIFGSYGEGTFEGTRVPTADE